MLKKTLNQLFFIVCITCMSNSTLAKSVSVSISNLSDVAIYPKKTAFAAAITLNDTMVSAEVITKIVAINAEVGQIVKKGDILVNLDSSDFNLALQQAGANLISAQSQLKLSRKQLERAEQLVSDGFISPEALNIRETEHAEAQSLVALYRAKYETAKRTVAKCALKAPFNAVIRERLGQVGEITTVGNPLLRLNDIENIEVDAKLLPADVGSLTKKSQISFITGGETFPIKLKRIVPAVNEKDRNQTARFEFIKNKPAIGSAGTIVWGTNKPHVPVDLMVQRNGELGIFLYEDGNAIFFKLPEASEGNPALVELAPDTTVISQGQYRLQDKQAVILSNDIPEKPE